MKRRAAASLPITHDDATGADRPREIVYQHVGASGPSSWKRTATNKRNLPFEKDLFWTVVALQLLIFVIFLRDPSTRMYSPLLDNGAYKKSIHDALFREHNWTETRPILPSAKPAPAANLTLLVLSTPRVVPYAGVLMSSLLNSNDPDELASTNVRILNTARPSSAHKDLEMFRLHQEGFKIIDMYQSTNSSYKEWHRRETHDYIAALQLCKQFNTSWCVVLEEDCFLTEHFLSKFWALVSDVDQAAYVKLFVADRWKGYESDLSHAVEILLIGAVGLVIFLLVATIPSIRNKRLRRRRESPLSLAQASRLYIIFAAWLYLNARFVSRQALRGILLQTRRRHRLQPCTMDASTVGMAFPRTSLEPALEYLQRPNSPSHKLPIDLELARWTHQSTHQQSFMAVPSLVQHVGAYTSKKNQSIPFFNREVTQDSLFRVQ
jgi:hypothetical protein